MNRKQRLIWEVYFLIVALFYAKRAFIFFDPESEVNLYYRLASSFDIVFLISYFLCVLQIISNFILLLPLLLFIYNLRLFPRFFWSTFFILKLAIDITGHSYELNYYVSLYYHDPLVSISVVLFDTLLFMPAYIAVFFYAFRQDKLRLKDL